MAMTVLKQRRRMGNNRWYESGFRHSMENHLAMNPAIYVQGMQPLSARQLSKFRFDLHGLLTELSVPAQFHWVTARINKLPASSEFHGAYEFILMPHVRNIEAVMNRYIGTQARLN